MNRFGNHAFEPRWRIRRHLWQGMVPAEMACWLFDSGSLTARMIAACRGQFRVELISQGWQRPMLNEALRLNMDPDRLALVRQVYLYCDDTPWVFARTVIPRTTLSGPQRHLANLGTRPLGAVLFADPHMRRDEVEVACIRSGQRIFHSATRVLRGPVDEIWGRRSVFYLDNKALLVNEVFLPEIRRCH